MLEDVLLTIAQSLRHGFSPDDTFLAEYLRNNFLSLATQRNSDEVLHLLFLPNMAEYPHELTFTAIVALQKRFLESPTQSHLVSKRETCDEKTKRCHHQLELLHFVANTILAQTERLKHDLASALDSAQIQIANALLETTENDDNGDFEYMREAVDAQVKEGTTCFSVLY